MKKTTIISLIIAVLAVACRPEVEPATPTVSVLVSQTVQISPSPIPPATPQPAATLSSAAGGTAILGLIGQPQSLNPILEYGPALEALKPLLFDTLLRVDPQTAQLQPGLAQSWHYSEDGRLVTFQLPPQLAWSDGSPLTAAAIAASLQATRHPALGSFSQISAPNDQTLIMTFSTIDCGAVSALSQLPILPAVQILDPEPMGSGPFIIADQSEDRRSLTLAQNQSYYGQRPALETLLIRFIREQDAKIALSEGQFDVIGPFPFDTRNPDPERLAALTYLTPQMIYVAINYEPKNGAALLPAVRQALLLALDREAILAEALDGAGQLIAGPLVPGHWAADTELKPPAYDANTARVILARAGIKDTDFDGWLDRDGQRLELAIRVNGEDELQQRLGWLVSSYYRDLGIYARAESGPPDSIIDDLFTHDFRLAIFRSKVLPEPDQRFYWRSSETKAGEGLNFTSYNNPQLDHLLDQGVSVPGCHPEERTETYRQIQKILSQERPVDFLVAPDQHLFVTRRLSGLAPGPFAPFTWNANQWYLALGFSKD